MPTIPKPDESTRELFRAILPADPRVQMRPMFGNLAAFVNGNMFTGLLGNDFFVRPPEKECVALLAEPGARVMEPMPGRPMREYVVMPGDWHGQPERLREWSERPLAATATMPAKAAKGAKKKR